MKLRHWLITGFVLIGALYLFHNYQQHGGVSGVKSGLGLGH
jgi:hypothetical protein